MRNHCCFGKGISIAYSECASIALFMRHAKCMRHVIDIFCPSGSTMFFHISHKITILGGKKLLNIKFVIGFSVQIFYETFFILRRTEAKRLNFVLVCEVTVIIFSYH